MFELPVHWLGKSHANLDEALERAARMRRIRTDKYRSVEQYREL